jgi:hypothetical protein
VHQHLLAFLIAIEELDDKLDDFQVGFFVKLIAFGECVHHLVQLSEDGDSSDGVESALCNLVLDYGD